LILFIYLNKLIFKDVKEFVFILGLCPKIWPH
jgi:hypothetical protein